MRRLLFLLLPRDAGVHQHELDEQFEYCVRRERARLGRLGVPYAWARLVLDVVMTSLLLRRDACPRDARTRVDPMVALRSEWVIRLVIADGERGSSFTNAGERRMGLGPPSRLPPSHFVLRRISSRPEANLRGY